MAETALQLIWVVFVGMCVGWLTMRAAQISLTMRTTMLMLAMLGLSVLCAAARWPSMMMAFGMGAGIMLYLQLRILRLRMKLGASLLAAGGRGGKITDVKSDGCNVEVLYHDGSCIEYRNGEIVSMSWPDGTRMDYTGCETIC